MPKPSPSLYSIQKTFFWFAVVSLVLTASLVAIVLLDHRREWKEWQKQFNRLRADKLKGELEKAAQSVDSQKLGTLQAALAEAEAERKKRDSEIQALRRERDKADARLAKVKAQYQTLKQFEDSHKYYLEEYREHRDPKAAGREKKLAALRPELDKLKIETEELEKKIESTESKLAGYDAKQKDIGKEIDKVLEEKSRLGKRLERVRPSVVKDVLNAPMLDFIAPTLQVKQIVLEDLTDDYHYAKVQKVDRCTTCHLGIDQKGFEDAPQPFRTHPKPELYLSASSPHPLEKIGCTSCHGGSGQAVSFVETAHTPRDEQQAAEWKKKYRWRKFEVWDNQMLPLQHVQAACAKCHQSVVEVPQADKLNQGRRLAEAYGCFNCHKVKGFEDRWQAGPDLTRVHSKLTEDWMNKWLDNPQDFRPSTKMPRVFHLSNTSSPEDKAKNIAAIHSITAYLIRNSEPVNLTAPAQAGDAAKGEKLVKDLGCLGCHSLPGAAAGDWAPELSGLGSKLSPDWLYTWLKNPKQFSPHTRMPSLRLSDEEAADITAYLLAQKNENFEKKAVPAADPQVVDELILESMLGSLRRSEAVAALAKMSDEEKIQYLGKKSISHQGCFTCHSIKGFEDVKPIGAELSDEGRKDIHKFDFGFIHLEHTRQDWIAQKLKDPRIFDHGKIRSYYEKLRMPQFAFTDEERDALVTFVLSLSEESIPVTMQKIPDLKEAGIEDGRLLVAKLNCTGCHSMDGKEGVLRRLAEDVGNAPPILDGEGAKVQEKWLYEFLHSPTTIRPWLTARMPTFGLSSEELDTLVFYFHHAADQKISFSKGGVPESSPEMLDAGRMLFDSFQCVKCHQVTQEAAAMGSSFLAPDLSLTKTRLKPDWVKEWLRDPQLIQPGTMMPTYFTDGQSPMADVLGGDAEKQIQAIRDYLYRYETAPDPKS